MAPCVLLLLLLGLGWAGPAGAAAPVHHELSVELDPPGHRITVTDTVVLPASLVTPEGTAVTFRLHPALAVAATEPGVALEPVADAPGDGAAYRVRLPAGVQTFSLRYTGELHDPLSAEQDYARGFRQTSGLVAEEGAFLSGATLWVPQIGFEFVTFSLDVRLPAGWDAVSQGRRTAHRRDQDGTRARWEEEAPQEEIYLVAGPFTESSQRAGAVEVQVFLREPDPPLAGKYLEVGGQYLAMYSRLLGPYPYAKFALVENFWDTGYGMPSFTLLGSRIIRFPFILHSSYPHEILHNWWGNGVYVDWEQGNWCEGLTAYLADHLIQEGRGAGAEYRQSTLQKYADYAAKGRDFPLREFRARHSSATEAVGYGKGLMFYHMLRRRLGDEAFVQG
ncbi:MAG: peptidase M28, partial [Proteobacteria bacterium]|nr:peptidase M28 [Pseudomonadota bacterium]